MLRTIKGEYLVGNGMDSLGTSAGCAVSLTSFPFLVTSQNLSVDIYQQNILALIKKMEKVNYHIVIQWDIIVEQSLCYYT